MAKIIFVIVTIMVSSLALANTCDNLNQVAWLQGQWQANSDKYQVSESWRKISAVTYEGRGQTLSTKTGKMISAETLRLVEMMEEVFLIAKVASNPLPVAFKLIKCSDGMAVFENTAHDFPKRLAYLKHADDHLSVEVSGDDGYGFTLAYKRKVHIMN